MVYVFDRQLSKWIMRELSPADPLPGASHLSVSAFTAGREYDVIWGDLEVLRSAELLSSYSKEPVTYAYRRVKERAHTGQSAHYAGLAFHIGRSLSTDKQMDITKLALEVCGFDLVEPPFLTPGWVHVEKSISKCANLSGGYPALRQNDCGVHVMVLQDSLNISGVTVPLTGCYTDMTLSAVARFQRQAGLTVTGETDSNTWAALMGCGGMLRM